MNAYPAIATTSRLANRPTRLSREVATEVTGEIVRGTFPPGSVLPPEPALCETFGVSRPVIREAIKFVEQNGLVRIRQGEGTTVLPRQEWNLLDPDVLRVAMETEESGVLREDVVTMRCDLELAMLRRGAAKLTAADFAEMESYLKVIDNAEDNDVLHDADRAFHGVIYRASGNEIARTVVNLLIAETRPVRYLGVPGPEDFRIANKSHYRILESLRSGKLDDAAAALRENIMRQWIVDRSDRLQQDPA
jgi:DNA-binding FadR family transcriptional regulator